MFNQLRENLLVLCHFLSVCQVSLFPRHLIARKRQRKKKVLNTSFRTLMINYLKTTAGTHKQCSLWAMIRGWGRISCQSCQPLWKFTETHRSYTTVCLIIIKLCFSEEMKNPSRNIPLTVMTAVPAVIVFYLLVNISYLTVLTPKEIVSSGMNLIFLWERWGPLAYLFDVNVLDYLCSPNSTIGKCVSV